MVKYAKGVEEMIKDVERKGIVNYCGWCGKRLPSYSKWKKVLCKECSEGTLQ
jgi:hypothetical protein